MDPLDEMIQLPLPLGPDLPNKTLFRPDEVAKFFAVSPSTIYRWVDEGILNACKPAAGTVRIFRVSIIEVLKTPLR